MNVLLSLDTVAYHSHAFLVWCTTYMTVRCCWLIDRLLESELLDNLSRTEIEELVDLLCDVCVAKSVSCCAISVYEMLRGRATPIA